MGIWEYVKVLFFISILPYSHTPILPYFVKIHLPPLKIMVKIQEKLLLCTVNNYCHPIFN
jgi:hypothetical protein